MSGWLEQLGPLAGPLGVCSLLTLALILERMLFFASLGRSMVRHLRPLLAAARTGQWAALAEQCEARWGLPAEGLRLLLAHRARPRGLREEMVGLWLGERRRELHARVRWLMLLAAVSPLLGLLGTVLGMIEAFQALVAHAWPVQPAVIAGGLRQAMLTTVVGLIVAVPALVAGHGFRIWADAYLATLEHLLNQFHLAIDGVFDASEEGAGDPDESRLHLAPWGERA